MRSLTLAMLVSGALACSNEAAPPPSDAAGTGAAGSSAAGAGAAGAAGSSAAGSSAAGAGAAGAAGATGAAGAAGAGGSAADAGLPTRYDYVSDIEPILARYCISCHGPSEIGPFRLDTYAAAKTAAGQAAGAISAGIMPPCEDQPAGGCSRPTAEETAKFVEWAASARPEKL